MGKIIVHIKRLSKVPWLAEALASVGSLIYIVQIWIYAHTQDTVLDEGLYLLKGYLFATGEYKPFQPYGLWTNKMPLAFLIPGYVQRLFGPGLRTGRYFAILLSILFLLGVWIVAKRLGGKWGGATAVFLVALNPANLKLYSMMLSEGLVAAILIWVLVLTLGEKRPIWQLVLGAFLAGLIPLTRINMTPVLPFVLAYIFWEQGLWAGIWATVGGLTAFVGGHALFWPGILSNWMPWIPAKLTPFLDTWRAMYDHGRKILNPQISGLSRFTSFFEGIRFHFGAIVGAFTSWLLWPKKWEKRSHFKIAVFLSSLFILLLGLHGWVTLLKGKNVFGFSIYISFFEVLGILLLITTWKNWCWELKLWRRIVALTLLGIVLLGIANISASPRTLPGKITEWFLGNQAIQFEKGKFTLASWQWWEVIRDRFGSTYNNIAVSGSRIILMSIAVGVFVVAIKVAKRIALDLHNLGYETFSSKAVVSLSFTLVLGLGVFASPLEILGSGRHALACRWWVISSYENAAKHIAMYINPGEKVYWKGGDTQVVLLELGDIELYPQQLNSIFSYYHGGDSDILAKHGFWNDTLDRQWASDADVILIEDRSLDNWMLEYLSINAYDETTPAPPVGCREGTSLRIYRRIP